MAPNLVKDPLTLAHFCPRALSWLTDRCHGCDGSTKLSAIVKRALNKPSLSALTQHFLSQAQGNYANTLPLTFLPHLSALVKPTGARSVRGRQVRALGVEFVSTDAQRLISSAVLQISANSEQWTRAQTSFFHNFFTSLCGVCERGPRRRARRRRRRRTATTSH